MKKEEGKAFDLNTEETSQKVLEVGTETNETKVDDKTSFENFKVLYDGRIKEKCLADYGTTEDKDLLEDTAKELYLASQELIPDEDTKSEGDLEEEKTKQEENVKWHGKTFKDKKNEAILDDNSKFLAHILNGVISDVQDKFNVTATGELDIGNKNKVVVTLKGNTLDLIDATSYLSKAIRRDDVDFTFDDEIKNNTVRCVISPKVKTESKEDDSIEQIENRIKEINKQLSYIRRRDRVSLSIGSEEEQEELRSERAKLNGKLRKLRNDKVNMDKMTPEQQEEFKQKLKDLELWDGTEEGLPGAIQIYRLFHMKDESKELSESKENDNEYNYMLLSRLKSDCEYFLGNGNRYEKHLWAGNVDDQIAKMKELYNKLPEKPEWLSMEDIENYEKEMKQDKKMESKFDKSQAVLSLDNYHSMGIIVSDDGSTVQYMYSNDEDSVYESDIEYDEEGRPYFKDEEGETWYIDEFMKTTFSESKEVKEESSTNDVESIKATVWREFWNNGELYNLMVKSHNNNEDIEQVLKNTDWALNIKSKYNLDDSNFNNLIHYLCYYWDVNSTPRSIHINNVSESKEVKKESEVFFPLDSKAQEKYKYKTVKDTNGTFFDIYKIGDSYYDVLGNEVTEEGKDMNTAMRESKEVKKEARDRVAENLPKFVYDLTKADFDKYGETAWSANGPTKDANGRTIYEVYRNGKSDFTIAYVVAEIQKEFPELKMTLQSTAQGDDVFFVKETKKQESQSTEVGYNEFTEDMEEIERTINFIKEPKNKDAKEVLDDVKEFLNKLWADKEQNTFGIKYAESKELTEEVEESNTNKIDDIVAQLMEELPDFAQGYRDIIMELGLSKEDFIDMITTENEHQLLKDKNITEDEEKEVYGRIYDTLV